ELHAVPPAGDGGTAAIDWGPLFEAAGLDRRQLSAASPRLPRPPGAEEQRAWEGAFPERPDVPIRVEAASARGRPVFLFVSSPGRDVPRLAALGEQPNQGLRNVFEFGLPVLVLVAGGMLAYHNLRRGRADLQGGWRLGLFVFAVALAAWLVRAHHAPA